MTCDNEAKSHGVKGRGVKRSGDDSLSSGALQTGLALPPKPVLLSSSLRDSTISRGNDARLTADAPSSSAKRRKRMEIETEFRILKSLIPNIADKQKINELEIIDACVNYIEALQDQLNIRHPGTPDPSFVIGVDDDDTCDDVNDENKMWDFEDDEDEEEEDYDLGEVVDDDAAGTFADGKSHNNNNNNNNNNNDDDERLKMIHGCAEERWATMIKREQHKETTVSNVVTYHNGSNTSGYSCPSFHEKQQQHPEDDEGEGKRQPN